MEALSRAYSRREALFAERADTDAFRLFSGAREGIDGLVVDRYADVACLVVHEGTCELTEPQLREAAEWYLAHAPVASIYLKRFIPDRSRSKAQEALFSPTPFAGRESPAVITMRENGVKYVIRPYDGFSTGLFLDQRENRRFLAGRGKRVLNCFAYTCGFSVAAALAGAETTSVDLSRRYLDWGKENFAANGLDAAAHRFFVADTFRFFKGGEKRGEVYDLIVLDPPSFSRTKDGDVFSLKKDLGRLLEAALPLVAKDGALFFSCNLSEWDSTHVRNVMKKTGGNRDWRFSTLPVPPEDFSLESHPLSSFLAERTN